MTEPPAEGLIETQTTVLRGVVGGTLMGLANLVPGISGGTMLLAAGIYPQFIRSVAEITTFKFRARSMILLASVVGAALVAIVLLAGVIGSLVVDHRWVMYSLFIGLTLGGAPILWKMLASAQRETVVWVMVVVGIGIMAAMAFLQPSDAASDAAGGHPYLLYFVAGVAGASAMVLPGISGGYLLLILGQYIAVLAAVSSFKDAARAGDWDAVGEAAHVLVPLGIGVVVGVVVVSNLVRYLLARFQAATLGLLLGLLLGAVIGIWPFQDGVPPAVGAEFRGDIVTEVEGRLVMAGSGKDIEPKHYSTEVFTPSGGQIAGALGLVILGFGIASGVARLGDAGSPRRNSAA